MVLMSLLVCVINTASCRGAGTLVKTQNVDEAQTSFIALCRSSGRAQEEFCSQHADSREPQEERWICFGNVLINNFADIAMVGRMQMRGTMV